MTAIEVALKEGQVLVNGFEQPDGQITASSAQIAFVSAATVSQNLNATGFGGNCLPISSANGLGPGAVTAGNAPISFTFTENGNIFNVTGTLSGDGQSLLNGTYTAESGNTCSDPGGTITGAAVPKLTGTYTGQTCPVLSSDPCQSTDNVTATLSESSSGTLTFSLVLSGTDNANFTMTGPVTGNAFTVQGTFQGQLVTFYGYYEQIYNAQLGANVASLYLVNATAPIQPFYVGTLAVPQT